jgi:hypothetical protein
MFIIRPLTSMPKPTLPKSTASPSLHLTLNPSIKLQQFNLAAHGLALIAVFLNNLPWLLRIAIAVIVASDLWIKDKRIKNESRIITYNDRSGWQLKTGANLESIDILTSTVVTPAVIFLHTKARPAQIIVHDALDEDDFRRLIVKLKLTIKQQPKQDNFP